MDLVIHAFQDLKGYGFKAAKILRYNLRSEAKENISCLEFCSLRL